MKILILILFSNPLFAYNSDIYQSELNSITPAVTKKEVLQIKAKTKKLKRRDRLVSTEKIEDLEAKYFDQIKTLNAAPLKKSSKPKKLRSR